MGNFTDFALRDEYTLILSAWDKLAKIYFSIDWKSFHIILEPISLNKTVFWSRPEAEVITMFKLIFSQQEKLPQ